MKLDGHDIERIAARIAEILRDELLSLSGRPARLTDASTVARALGVERDWVYAHAQELGAVRLGGPHGRLRFDLDRIQRQLASGDQQAADRQRPHPPLKPRAGSSNTELLPYVGSPAIASRRQRARRAPAS